MIALSAPLAASTRPRSRVAVRSARPTVCRASAEDTARAAKAAAVAGVLSAVMIAPAQAVLAIFPQVDVAEATTQVKTEFETRYKACSTDECRQVITNIANRKFAKLTGQPAGTASFSFTGEAPPVKAAPKPTTYAVQKPAPTPKPEVAEVAKPAAVAAPKTNTAAEAAAKKAADDKKKAEEAAAKKKADEAAAKKKAEEAKKKKEEEERRKRSQGTNPILYETGFLLKGAFAAGAVAAPFIYLKKDEVLLNEAGEVDPDKFVGKVKAAVNDVPNAPVVAAYGAAGAIALSLVDGAVNLPLLNILIGVPVQILGLFTAVALGLRYVKEGKSWEKDFKNTHAKLNNLIPDDLPRPLPETLSAEWESK